MKVLLIILIIGLAVILIFLLPTFLIGLSGFGPGPSDYAFDLPGGYQLVRTSAHDVKIVPKDGWDPRNPPPLIPAKVVEVAFDQRYILAKRYELRAAYPGSNNSYEIPDEQKAVYYIFDTLALKIYEYRSLEEFNNAREMLKVPPTLKLRDVADIARSSNPPE
ncbi:hypothetical protein CVV65_05605 [Kyrpidia spormannii]|uniref:DUF3997 domain-containing protein n=1 Tax=Kyrpidia spormannii TaxID=2055160 RepID=A0A2K8N6Q5_9BACL|nr:DUF3997 domain-containing protein [Kyrpidia spormannii]ATY84497.1 hypothetical protein CVV65_05605 [Kyrpidia spormannii]